MTMSRFSISCLAEDVVTMSVPYPCANGTDPDSRLRIPEGWTLSEHMSEALLEWAGADEDMAADVPLSG
jgi:hypothetical protein